MYNKHITEIVETTLAEFKEGQAFFSNLDSRFRNTDCCTIMLLCALTVYKEYNFIVTGEFGKSLYLTCPSIIKLRLPGNLRHTKKCDLSWAKDYIAGKKFILLDDSFYSGRTRDVVAKELSTQGGVLVGTLVMYDGCKEKDLQVDSFYRYFDYYNFDGTRKEAE